MVIAAGRLRHRVQIEADTPTRASDGGDVEAWSTVATVWAGIEPLSGREYFTAQQTQSQVTHKITVRYFRGLTAAHRIKYGSRTFQIEGVRNMGERNAKMELMAKENP